MLAVAVVYVVLVLPKTYIKTGIQKSEKEYPDIPQPDSKNGFGLAENSDENGVSQGASGQMKYRFGYTQ